MLFCKDIEPNEFGVSQTLEKIYLSKPEFKQYFKLELENAEKNNKNYIKEYKLSDILKGIKKIIIPRVHLLPDNKGNQQNINNY